MQYDLSRKTFMELTWICKGDFAVTPKRRTSTGVQADNGSLSLCSATIKLKMTAFWDMAPLKFRRSEQKCCEPGSLVNADRRFALFKINYTALYNTCRGKNLKSHLTLKSFSLWKTQATAQQLKNWSRDQVSRCFFRHTSLFWKR
jgi:hypothetical protein